MKLFLMLLAGIVIVAELFSGAGAVAPDNSDNQGVVIYHPPVDDDADDSTDNDYSPDIQSTYRVRGRGWSSPYRNRRQAMISHAVAVNIGGGRLLTVAHLTQGMHQPVAVDVEVNGQWLSASFQPVGSPAEDRAVVQLQTNAPGFSASSMGSANVASSEASYGSRVTIKSLATGQEHQGFYIPSNTTNVGVGSVALDADDPGLQKGDSGSGVFNEEGELIATVRTRYTYESRIAGVTPVTPQTAFKSRSPQLSGQQQNSVLPVLPVQPPVNYQYQSGNCANGQCQLPAMQYRSRRSRR